jgi:hypothetical protein
MLVVESLGLRWLPYVLRSICWGGKA